ncbi:hypothetical protein H8E77_13335 [bacterium]|nr:hypothetical protein [bacterium]
MRQRIENFYIENLAGKLRILTEADLSQLHRLSYTIAVDMADAMASINQTLERR